MAYLLTDGETAGTMGCLINFQGGLMSINSIDLVLVVTESDAARQVND